MLGDEHVGKTTLFFRLIKDELPAKIPPTTYTDVEAKTLIIEGKILKLLIYDTSGLRYRSIIKNYISIVQGIMLVYDITNIESFNNLNSWLNDIKENAPENINWK